MARTKQRPLHHIPFPPKPEVTGTANPQNTTTTTNTEKMQVAQGSTTSSKTTDISSAIKSTSSTPFSKETRTPAGVTECPHCNVDFKDMAVSDVRSHVESCSRPTTAGSESDTSELSDPPESPNAPKESADQVGNDDQESDVEALSELEDFDEEVNLENLPGPYIEDDEETQSLNEDSTSDVKFPKLTDTNDILGTLDDIENLDTPELYRRAANVASILDTYQKEWMALEKETAKATPGDGVPILRNPRIPRNNVAYQDRLEADVYGYEHNPHPNALGKQNPIAQRPGNPGDGELRHRLRKQTKKAVEADNESDQNPGESSRPVRNRNTPSRYESESREQTPALRKPQGRGKGGRVDELRSEIDARSLGARTRSPLVSGGMGEYAPQSSSSLRDRAFASTEVDEEDSGANSRPSTRSSSRSIDTLSIPHDGQQQQSSSSGRKRRAATAIDGDTKLKPNKKARTKSNGVSATMDTNGSGGASKSRAKNMIEVEPGVYKSSQSVMMTNRWKAFKNNPGGPRIGRKSKSEKDGGSDIASSSRSRKHSLEETNDQADASRGSKKRKLSKEEPAAEENSVERLEQAPAKGKRGGRREGSGRKPAKASSSKGRSSHADTSSRHTGLDVENSASVERHLDDEHNGEAQTPGPAGDEEPSEPSSGSTRTSTRARKPSSAKIEADDGMSPGVLSQPPKKARGQWGGKRQKGKRNDGTLMMKAKQSAKSQIPTYLEEGMIADTDRTEEEEENGQGEGEDEEQSSVQQKKSTKGGKSVKAEDEFTDLPVYNKDNPSKEYQELPKNLKMKAVSRARWATGGMDHMFGQKGPNKTTKEKMVKNTNSARTSVSSTRRRSIRNTVGLEGSDNEEEDTPTIKRKISEYEEFLALASPSLAHEGGGKKRRRPAALRASTSFVEPNSSEFEDDDAANGDEYQNNNGTGAAYGNGSTPTPQNNAPKQKIGKNGSRKGIGGRPRKIAVNPIQTDVANAISRPGSGSGSAMMRGSAGGAGGSTRKLTTYEEFQALSAPGSPMVLEKRKSNLRGGDMEGFGGEMDEEYEYQPSGDEFKS